ncbi:sickle tail protein-like isoform X2 [Mustelus asterias]
MTQFSNKDINRLLEETQAELMKAIPDLGFTNKTKMVTMPTAESKQAKPQHTQKTVTKTDANGRRHSEELTVHRYRTEKPSKSPPPPPPRRSFPSSHGLTTGRTGEVIVTNKKEASLKKADSDETDGPRPHVKLRRTMSEAKPPSTPPPIVASAVRDDEDEEDRIMAELEVFQRSAVSYTGSKTISDQGMAAFPTPDPRSCWVTLPTRGLKEIDVPTSPSLFQLPQTVSTSASRTPNVYQMIESEAAEETALTTPHKEEADRVLEDTEAAGRSQDSLPPQGQQALSSPDSWMQFVPSAIVLEEFMLLEKSLEQSNQTGSQPPPPDQENSEAEEIQDQQLESSPTPGSDPTNGTEVAACAGDAEENVAFMITENQIQALSRREVQDIVKGEDIQTWNVSSGKEVTSEGFLPQDPIRAQAEEKGPIISLDEKPVVVIFEEPMDIRTAYKRLSTVFEEYDEEFQTAMGEKDSNRETQTPSILLEQQEEASTLSSVSDGVVVLPNSESNNQTSINPSESDVKFDDAISDVKPLNSIPNVTSPETTDLKSGNSKSVKIQLPKQQLNALTKAIESGTKTGRKILQVVIYEEEEKIDKVTGKKQTEVKKYQINQIEKSRPPKTQNTTTAFARTEEIKNSAYKRMDSLEETIRELESTISQISQHPGNDFIFSKEFLNDPNIHETREELVDDPNIYAASNQPPVDVSHPMAQPSLALSTSKESLSPTSKVKPPLLPKPQLPPADAKAGGVPSPQSRIAIPAAPKLKQQYSSGEKLKHIRHREEYLKVQGQQGSQQVVYFLPGSVLRSVIMMGLAVVRAKVMVRLPLARLPPEICRDLWRSSDCRWGVIKEVSSSVMLLLRTLSCLQILVQIPFLLQPLVPRLYQPLLKTCPYPELGSAPGQSPASLLLANRRPPCSWPIAGLPAPGQSLASQLVACFHTCGRYRSQSWTVVKPNKPFHHCLLSLSFQDVLLCSFCCCCPLC